MKADLIAPTLFVAALLSSTSIVHAGSEDWLCDLTSSPNPPSGCVVWGPQHRGGLCTSLESTIPWHCLTGWNQSSQGGGIGSTMVKSLHANSLERSEYALTDVQSPSRSARLQVNTDAVQSTAKVLELLPQDAASHTLRVSAVRNLEGAVELVVTAIGRPDAQGEALLALLARLPLRQGQVTVIARWHVDPVDGPRLSLASGSSRVEVSLPALDAHTRLNVYGGASSKLWFDIHTAPAQRHQRDLDPR